MPRSRWFFMLKGAGNTPGADDDEDNALPCVSRSWSDFQAFAEHVDESRGAAVKRRSCRASGWPRGPLP